MRSLGWVSVACMGLAATLGCSSPETKQALPKPTTQETKSKDESKSKQQVSVALRNDHKDITEYAKLVGLEPTHSVDLGDGLKMEMVLVPAGEFMMGGEGKRRVDWKLNEGPAHKVKISKPYYIGKYEVTVAYFRAFAAATKYQTEAEKYDLAWTVQGHEWKLQNGINWRNPGFKQDADHPACVISWNDAQEFCKWATKVAGKTVRLPTEAEWEYAARGPQGPKYPWGDNWDGATSGNAADASLKATGVSMVWDEVEESDGFAHTSPVGHYRTNVSWCGAFDMAGNIREWVDDQYDEKYYANSPAVDPPGPTTGIGRVLRGGCWYNGRAICRSACRDAGNAGDCSSINGFRVVLESGLSKNP
jgi:formylglycine-generating enzyme